MTRLAKLHDKLRRGAPLTFSEFERLVQAFGFELDRQRGSHRIYRRAGIADRLNLQPAGKETKPYQVEQFLAIIERNALTLDESE